MTDSIDQQSTEEAFIANELRASNACEPRAGDIIEGIVTEVTAEAILLDIAHKTDAYLPRNEFDDHKDIHIGDKIRVEIVDPNADQGAILVSRRRVVKEDAFGVALKHFQSGEEITGKIRAVQSHGFEVSLMPQLNAFMPFSHTDADKKIINPETYVGKEFPVLVIKAQRHRQSYDVVVSRKEYLLRETHRAREAFFKKFDVGDAVTGIVDSIFPNYARINVEGVMATIAQEEVSWLNNAKLSKLKTGQPVQAKIIDISEDKRRVSLSVKALTDDPWLTIKDRIKVDTILEGTVESAKKFGLFVRVANLYQGLAHVSEISWDTRDPDLQQYHTGQKVKVKVLAVEPENRRLTLSIKQAQTSPWENFCQEHADTPITVTVKRIHEYGLLCALPDSDIEGFLHKTQIGWGNKPYILEDFSVGETLEVVPLSSDNKHRQVRLSMKAAHENPWDTLTQLKKENAVVEVTVSKKNAEGLIVSVGEGIEGFIHFTRLANFEHLPTTDLLSKFKAGDVLEANISMVDKQKKKIYLSTKHVEIARASGEMEKYLVSDDDPNVPISDLTNH